MRSIYKKIIHFLFWLQWRLNLYSKWSRFQNWFREGQYVKHHPVAPTKTKTLEELGDAISTVEWKQDDWVSLFDHISTPEKIQYIIDTGQQVESGSDCDDVSLYAAAVIKWWKSHGPVKGVFGKLVIGNPYVMSTVWLDGWKQNGHNVCIFSYWTPEGYLRYGCISNWNNGQPVLGFNGYDEIIEYVLGVYDFVSAQILSVEKYDEPGYRVYTKSYMYKGSLDDDWQNLELGGY